MKQKVVVIDPNKYDMISAMKKSHNHEYNGKKCKEMECKKYIYFNYTLDKNIAKQQVKFISFAVNLTRGRRNKDRKKNKMDKKRKLLCENKINNKTIKEIESELKDYNSKTCNFNDFLMYSSTRDEKLCPQFLTLVQMKIVINILLYEHYKNEIYRILNFRNYSNTQRSESRMINRFREKMGSPEKVLIVLGDYSDTGLRGTPPSITVKIRTIFKNA